MRDELAEARGEINRRRRERDDTMRHRDRAVAMLDDAGHNLPAGIPQGFANHIVVPRWRPLDYPPISVQTDARDGELDQMSSFGSWTAWGRSRLSRRPTCSYLLKCCNITRRRWRSDCST
jgi:hypothetical protein